MAYLNNDNSSRDWTSILLWTVLALLLIVNIPIVLCMHLSCDPAYYDLQARCALEGGVIYQDLVEPNFPGVVWLHMLIRSLFGWSSVVLRSFDLLIVAANVWVISRLVRKPDEPIFSRRTGFLAVSLFALHFGLLEWCHCQRDLWALFPCLLATLVRSQRLDSLRQESQLPTFTISRQAFIEGTIWAVAFWIKPHIAIPALAVTIASWIVSGSRRHLIADGLGILAGGLTLGTIGSGWMLATGAWAPFWEMQLHWNGEYVRLGHQSRTLSKLTQVWNAFAPWNWFHPMALAIVVAHFCRIALAKFSTATTTSTPPTTDQRKTLLLALYCGWMMQALTLQFAFMYVFVPTVVLAVAIASTLKWQREYQGIATGLCGCAIVMMILGSPVLSPSRLANWMPCLRNGSTYEVRSRVQIETDPAWDELAPVIEFLESKQVQDGEVTAYSNNLVQIYSELGIRPSTRYVFLDVLIRLFTDRHQEIHDALAASKQKYVVTSLVDAGLPDEAITSPENSQTKLPELFPEPALKTFPFTQPVIFRSGRYLVHEVTRPLGEITEKHLISFWDEDNSAADTSVKSDVAKREHSQDFTAQK